MLIRFGIILLVVALFLLWQRQSNLRAQERSTRFPVEKTAEEWKKQLSAQQFHVLRERGTERAFTGQYADHHEAGRYACVGCGHVLFASEAKFDSGTGWPSFFQPFRLGSVVEESDTSWGMTRVEVLCANCGGHLGHVFPDGPRPTGRRYCINSVCLTFTPASVPAAPGQPSTK